MRRKKRNGGVGQTLQCTATRPSAARARRRKVRATLSGGAVQSGNSRSAKVKPLLVRLCESVPVCVCEYSFAVWHDGPSGWW